MASVLELTFKVFEATYGDFRYRFEVTGDEENHTVILKRKLNSLTDWPDRLTEVFDKSTESFKNIQLADAMVFNSMREAIDTISNRYL